MKNIDFYFSMWLEGRPKEIMHIDAIMAIREDAYTSQCFPETLKECDEIITELNQSLKDQ